MYTEPDNSLNLPDSAQIRSHVLESLGRYWPRDATALIEIPVREVTPKSPITGRLELVEVYLPEWGRPVSVDGYLLVPRESICKVSHEGELWEKTDWWLAAFLLLEAWHERIWELQYGTIHSYSFRLEGWDERAWQYAWVNRIALFLRSWSIRELGPMMEGRIGALPEAKVVVTHDVDAVTKTLPIRLKQGVFNLYNTSHDIVHGRVHSAYLHLKKAGQFLLSYEDWWIFEDLLRIESEASIEAIYHFHCDRRAKTLKRWLFDPGYDVSQPKLRKLLSEISEEGHTIGLHPGFDTWDKADLISDQLSWLETFTGLNVTDCRQHWLRFSWSRTWSAQQSAGITRDTTLMFNDRSGFRNSSALSWRPWNQRQCRSLLLEALPTVLMDSHFYDYQPMSSAQRCELIQHWIGECRQVHGEIAVLWHPQTLTEDYGWTNGFMDLIHLLRKELHG